MSSAYNSNIPARAFWFSQQPLPISTLTATLSGMDDNYRKGTFYIEFYDASGNVVTPTAGTVDVQASPLGKFFMRNHENQLYTAAAIQDHPVEFSGMMLSAKVTLAGITGATTWRAAMWRS